MFLALVKPISNADSKKEDDSLLKKAMHEGGNEDEVNNDIKEETSAIENASSLPTEENKINDDNDASASNADKEGNESDVKEETPAIENASSLPNEEKKVNDDNDASASNADKEEKEAPTQKDIMNEKEEEEDFVVVSQPNSPSSPFTKVSISYKQSKDKEEEEDADFVGDQMEVEAIDVEGYNDDDDEYSYDDDDDDMEEEEEDSSLEDLTRNQEETKLETGVSASNATHAAQGPTAQEEEESELPSTHENETKIIPIPPPTIEEFVTPKFLGEMITNGVQTYERFITTNANHGGVVEHTSVEDIFASTNKTFFPSLQLIEPARQGVLSNDIHQPLHLHSLLKNCRNDASSNTENWICMVITKTPETVAICLPPTNTTTSSSLPYVLIDSHPRPNIFPSTNDGSYAALHTTLGSLLETLDNIFPYTDLGDDIPDMMIMMYNSFDLYALQAV